MTTQDFSRADRIWGEAVLFGMRLIGWLPDFVLYGLADGVGWLLRRILHYRTGVVRDHLQTSFPDASEKQLKSYERAFYRHLGDLAMELFKLAAMGRRSLHRHVDLQGIDVFRRLYDSGHNMIYLTLGHYGNWEWFTGFQDFLPFTRMHVLYKRQKGITNYIMYRLRSKFGTRLIDRKVAPRQVLSLNRSGQDELLIFVSDQTPSIHNIHLFVDFLHRSTAVFTGMERLAAKTSSPVCYLDVVRKRRGRYVCTIELICEDASTMEEGEISRLFMNRLEETIRRQPPFWLWSHKRWKHTPEEIRSQRPEQHVVTQ